MSRSEANLAVHVLTALAYSPPVRDAACLALCEILVLCHAGAIELEHDAFDGLGISLTNFISPLVVRHLERRAADFDGRVREKITTEYHNYCLAIDQR